MSEILVGVEKFLVDEEYVSYLSAYTWQLNRN